VGIGKDGAMLAMETKNQILLACVVVGLTMAFLVAGAVTYGFSAEVRTRFWHDLLERPDQAMRFRFVLQPMIAAIAAVHDGFGRTPAPRRFAGRNAQILLKNSNFSLDHNFRRPLIVSMEISLGA
jgi:hypothetical protein